MSDDTRSWEPPLAGTEIEHVTGSLERLRATFAWKVQGLDETGLRYRLASSTVSLGGLLKHLARAEDEMFTRKLFGEQVSEPWRSAPWDDDEDWDFNSSHGDSPAELYRIWMSTVTRSRDAVQRALAIGGLEFETHLRWNSQHVTLRRLLFDLIEEYGRHTGHADLIREAIDGRVGEDPPDGFSWPVPFDL
jgi:hypothetical protein